MKRFKKTLTKLDLKFDAKRATFAFFTCLIVIFIVLRMPQNLDANTIIEFNRDLQNYNVKLQILDQHDKEVAKFSVAIADNDHKKMYGLMKLNSLPKDFGMLFPFFRNQVIAMWMKNTRIPLDMIFIDSDDIIASITTDTEPYSLEIISSEKEVNQVLEINAGLVAKLGIKVGQKIKISD